MNYPDFFRNEREYHGQMNVVNGGPSTVCRRCGRGLTNPASIAVGIGPVCRSHSKVSDKSEGNLFYQGRAKYDYGFAGLDIDIIWLRDLNGPRSLTNDMENAIGDLIIQGIDFRGKKVIYKDSLGVWDEVKIKFLREPEKIREFIREWGGVAANLHNFISIEFASIGETDFEKAVERLG